MTQTEKEPFSAVALRAALWLAFLAPFFYATYGGANYLASLRDDVPNVMFWWERWIPFVPWTIVPYWSINAFYALSLFINDTKSGVNRLAGRYLTAQLVAVACFIAFPMILAFMRPPTSGLPGMLFDILGGFDKPFNQAPSLHIALLVIIWDHLRHRISGIWLMMWNVWCFLIGISVLTTWQHHFIDIPTGALLGFFALWLFPRAGKLPFSGFRFTRDAKALRIGGYYAIGAAVCLAGAWYGAYSSALWLALLWPALALAIVAFGYFGVGPEAFQKNFDGSVSLASRVLLWPYRVFAKINAWAWTRALPASVKVAEARGENGQATTVFLGRFPSAAEAAEYDAVVDLTAEFARPRHADTKWQSVPMLDLVQPETNDRDLAAFIVDAYNDGTVLVCCALGFQRSASVAAEWLVRSGKAATRSEAETILRASGRPVHLHSAEAAA